MRWIVPAMAFAMLGCYSPRVRDCEQACGPNNTCGGGLVCETTIQRCRLPENMGSVCPDVPIDGSIDAEIDAAATADVAPEDCTWQLVSMNFEPTDLPTQRGDWNITADTTFTTGAAGGVSVAQPNGPDLWLVHHAKFTVAAGVTLTIQGMHPLVIAADEMDIKGTILVKNGVNPATCDAQPGQDSCAAGAGGGGGGYGGQGGNGGGPAGQGGTTSLADVPPRPLRGGCSGAKGGDGRIGAADPNPKFGGDGGLGGGGLQLSARLSVNISGSILANGAAGGPGKSDRAAGAACPGLLGRASGGGGGGGGGMIFVESCATTLTSTAKLCANGGGGGGGSGGGNTDTGVIGTDGRCDSVAPGGAGEFGDSRGGNGGFSEGVPAENGHVADRGGGGGGGAVGRIFLRQVAGEPAITGALIRPPANRSQ